MTLCCNKIFKMPSCFHAHLIWHCNSTSRFLQDNLKSTISRKTVEMASPMGTPAVESAIDTMIVSMPMYSIVDGSNDNNLEAASIDWRVMGTSNRLRFFMGLSWKKDRIRSNEKVCSLNKVESSAEHTTMLPEIRNVSRLVALCHKYIKAMRSICPATSNSVSCR